MLARVADKIGLANRFRGGELQQDFLHACCDMDDKRQTDYERAEAYYCHEHRVHLNTRERQYLEASGYRFAENYCETIVDAKANALRVHRFTSDETDLQDFAKRLWRANRMDAGQKRVHQGAVKLGDYFIIIEPQSNGLPKLCANDPRNVKIVYDSDEPLYAVKVWSTSRVSPSNPNGIVIERLNIYWPDQIEKWFRVSNDGDWMPFIEEIGGDYKAWWTEDGTASGEPLGIPVIHFANKPNPFYGTSKLRGVIPQQDALNKSIVDFFWVMDAQGWPQQWASGATAGDVKRHPGSLWTVQSPDARVGQLDPADPEKSITGIESQIKRMASRSNTPLHLMLAGGNLPSGESLKSSESGFIHEGEDFQTHNGNRWEDAVLLSARVANTYSNGISVEYADASLDCEWKSIETRNEVDEWNVAVLKNQLGVSSDTILSEQGYDPKAEREKRAKDPNLAAQQLLADAKAMTAPTRSEEAGGGQQPAQKPKNRVTG